MKKVAWQGAEWVIGVAMQMAKGSAGVSPAPVGILPIGLKAGKKIHRHAIRQVAGGWPARCRPERAGCPRSPGTQFCGPCRNFRDRDAEAQRGKQLRIVEFGLRNEILPPSAESI